MSSTLTPDRAAAAAESAMPAKPKSRVRRLVVASLLALVGVGCAVVAALGVAIVATAHSQDLTHSDALVVLGAAQFNGRPSPVLADRNAHAASLFARGVAARVITVGANQPGDLFTEAGTSRTWLIAHGVPARAVISVPLGHDTLTSLQAVARLMAAHRWTSVTIVTDAAHAFRSALIARDLGLKVHSAPTRTGPGSAVTARYVLREIASTLHYVIAERSGVVVIRSTN